MNSYGVGLANANNADAENDSIEIGFALLALFVILLLGGGGGLVLFALWRFCRGLGRLHGGGPAMLCDAPADLLERLGIHGMDGAIRQRAGVHE